MSIFQSLLSNLKERIEDILVPYDILRLKGGQSRTGLSKKGIKQVSLKNTIQDWFDNGDFDISGTDFELAQTLFVDTNGNNTTASRGEINFPWKTIQQAAAVSAVSGDNINVFKGTYLWDFSDVAIDSANPNSHGLAAAKNVSLEFAPGSVINIDAPAFALSLVSSQTSGTTVVPITFELTGNPDIVENGNITTLIDSSHSSNDVDIKIGRYTSTDPAIETQLGGGRGKYLNIEFDEVINSFRYAAYFAVPADTKDDADKLSSNSVMRVKGKHLECRSTSTSYGILFNFDIRGITAFTNINATCSIDKVLWFAPGVGGNPKQAVSFSQGNNGATISNIYNSYFEFKSKFVNFLSASAGVTTPYTLNGTLDDCGVVNYGNFSMKLKSRVLIDIDHIKSVTPVLSIGGTNVLDFAEIDDSTIEIRIGKAESDDFCFLFKSGGPTNFKLQNYATLIIRDSYFRSKNAFVGSIDNFDIDATSKIIFKNCTFEAFSAGKACIHTRKTVYFENCTFRNDGTVAPIQSDAATTVVLKDCYTNSLAADDADVTFVGTMNKNASY